MQIRVYYEDTDVGGVVYHSHYLNFCERARSELFFQKGLHPILKDSHFVVKKIVANFIASAKLGDMLEVQTKLIEIKSASLILLQTVYKEEKKLFEMEVVLAHIGFDGKVKRIDGEIKHLLQNIFTI